MAKPQQPVCRWRRDDHPDFGDAWDTDCGERFQFYDGGPTENGAKFCCYCGKRLKPVGDGEGGEG